MPKIIQSPDEFTIIAENIHATRIVLRNGKKAITLDDGIEAVPFTGEFGELLYLRVPEFFKNTQVYEQGQIKHFMIAMYKGISDNPVEQAEGEAYIHYEVRRQIKAGAHFLDLNVDEISYHLDIQKKAMAWLVQTTQKVASIPLSIDSSNPEIIASGLAVYDSNLGKPMINSVALERLETLDLVKKHNAKVIVTAAGVDGMPQNAEERVANVTQLMQAVKSMNIAMEDVYIDCLVFPIAVESQYVNHYLDAVIEIRKIYGTETHITGGLSNVSFGLPKRKLINDTFMKLGLDAGIDSGIIDPIQCNLEQVFNPTPPSEGMHMAENMLLGKDDFCMNYIESWRNGKL